MSSWRRWRMSSRLEQPAAEDGKLVAFIGGQNGMPRGLMYPNKLRFAPRFGLAHHFDTPGSFFRAAYGIFYTPVDLNTWCNQLHNVPLVFPITQQSDNFTPGINGFNFPQPVLGTTVSALRLSTRMRPRSISSNGARRCRRASGATRRSRSAIRASAGSTCSGRT